MGNFKAVIAIIFSLTIFTYSFGLNQTAVLGNQAGNLILSDAGEYEGSIAETAIDLTIVPVIVDSITDTTIKDDPYYNKQWALLEYNLPFSSHVITEKPVIVAVLDSGIDKNHEDLIGKVLLEIDLNDTDSPDDVKGHGTHIAGIIGANADNGIGIKGIAPESLLLNVKVTDDNGRCSAATLAEGIIWAADHGANVINISITINEGYSKLEEAIDYAWDKGAIIVAAAGNETINPVYPAYYANSISVLATNNDDIIVPLVYQDKWPQIAAPGFEIYSTLPDNQYGYWKGTSFAAAHVSGIAALLFSAAEDNNGNGKVNDEIRKAIEDGAIKSLDDGYNRINIENSLTLLTS